MITTVSHNDTVKQDIRDNPDFRRAFLAETIISLASGDVETGKYALKLHIEATIGYPALATELHLTTQDVEAMLAEGSNPDIQKFFQLLGYLQSLEGMELRFQAVETILEHQAKAA